jgi:hypothetical protein
MSKEPEQIEIDLEETAKKPESAEIEVLKAEDEPEVVTKAATKEIEPEEGLEALKAQLEREKTARIEAEKREREARQTAFKAQNEVQDSNLHLVTNAIETVKQTADVLKSNYREAMSMGDYDRAAEVQQAMATNAAKLLQLEQGKQALESQPKQRAPEQYRSSDPVEALASQLTPRSADWVRRNPQCVTDPRLYQKMVAAHNLAVADGYAPDTNDYFEQIESTLKLNRREVQEPQEDAMAEAAKPVQRRSSPAAAPVSRSGTGTGSRPNVVRLSSAEREMASMMGMTDQEYAKNKLSLQKEGKLN